MNYTNIDTKKKYVKMNPDVYEHLAKTFLENKVNKKDRRGKRPLLFIVSLVSVVLICSLLISFLFFVAKKNVYSKSLYVALDKSPMIIDYDFNFLGDAKIKAISLNLNNADLGAYKFLKLSLKTEGNIKMGSNIKVEIENSFLEKDAKYLSGINYKWNKYSLALSDFNLVKNWSSVKALTFIVEDWNVSNKKDKIYIDDVCFVE